jgi:hypothetical protein
MRQRQYNDIQIALGQMCDTTIAQLHHQLFAPHPVAAQNPNASARWLSPDREPSVMPIDATPARSSSPAEPAFRPIPRLLSPVYSTFRPNSKFDNLRSERISAISRTTRSFPGHWSETSRPEISSAPTSNGVNRSTELGPSKCNTSTARYRKFRNKLIPDLGRRRGLLGRKAAD